MSKPFQFSIRQLLCAMAWFCVATGFLVAMIAHANDQAGPALPLIFGIVSTGAGIGSLAGSTRKGAVFGFLSFILAAIVMGLVYIAIDARRG